MEWGGGEKRRGRKTGLKKMWLTGEEDGWLKGTDNGKKNPKRSFPINSLLQKSNGDPM